MAEGERGMCLCGCGETPVGGRFMPGHDARMEPMYRRWAAGDYDARLNRAQLEYLRERA